MSNEFSNNIFSNVHFGLITARPKFDIKKSTELSLWELRQ